MLTKKNKKMKRYLRFFLLFGWASICLFPSSTWSKTIRFATIDYCPFTCDPLKEEGKEGFMTDVLREVFEPIGYTLEIEMLAYARAVSLVQDGTYDGIVVVGKDFAPELLYPDMPTVIQRVAFMVNAGEPWEYTGIDSLPQVTVGIVKGYHYVVPDLVTYFEKERNNQARVLVIHGEGTTKRGIRLLQAKRITTFLEGEYSAMYELKKMGNTETVSIAGYTAEGFHDYSGFSPHNPDAVKYAQILSDSLAKLKKSGRLEDIINSYGVNFKQTP